MSRKVYKSELTISKTATLLDNEITDADKLINVINNFITSTKSSLKGEAYDAARAKIEMYISILEQRKTIAKELSSAIASAFASMNDFMGEYSELDDSKIIEIKTEINNINASIDQITYNYNQAIMTNTPITYNINSVLSPYITASQELSKLLEKILILGAIDDMAYAKIQNIASTIATYQSGINEIKETNINVSI